MKDSHGSVELSSLSLASAINSKGIYLIGAPSEKRVNDQVKDDQHHLVHVLRRLSLRKKRSSVKKKNENAFIYLFLNSVES